MAMYTCDGESQESSYIMLKVYLSFTFQTLVEHLRTTAKERRVECMNWLSPLLMYNV